MLYPIFREPHGDKLMGLDFMLKIYVELKWGVTTFFPEVENRVEVGSNP